MFTVDLIAVTYFFYNIELNKIKKKCLITCQNCRYYLFPLNMIQLIDRDGNVFPYPLKKKCLFLETNIGDNIIKWLILTKSFIL